MEENPIPSQLETPDRPLIFPRLFLLEKSPCQEQSPKGNCRVSFFVGLCRYWYHLFEIGNMQSIIANTIGRQQKKYHVDKI